MASRRACFLSKNIARLSVFATPSITHSKTLAFHKQPRILSFQAGIYVRFCQTATNVEPHPVPESSRSERESDEAIRKKILARALAQVPHLGWTDAALVQGVREATGLSSLAHTMIERGAVEIVEFFLEEKRKHVQKIMQSHNERDINNSDETNSGESTHLGRDNLYRAMVAHLEYTAPYLSNWSSALALLSDPLQAPHTLTIMNDIADDLCHFSDMKATRLGWYLDRGALIALLGSAELFMLTDYSDNFSETKSFLSRSIDAYFAIKSSSVCSQSLHTIYDVLQGIAKRSGPSTSQRP